MGASTQDQGIANVEARTTLAALGLAAIARQWAAGFSLRSRCDLLPRAGLASSLLAPGHEEHFTLSPDDASQLLARAVSGAKRAGLPWPTGPDDTPWEDGCLTLRPNAELAKAVAQSRRLAAEERE
ncbi:MAG: hypothetical protein AB1505_01970 [Candidatus Latescibacterota bacterium]